MNPPPPAIPEPRLLLMVVASACLGALVGLLRQWTDWADNHRDINFGGARTYALWAMLGCLGAATVGRIGPSLLVALVVAVAAHEIAAMAHIARRRTGGTSFAAVLLTVAVGACVAWEEWNVAIVVAAATAITLGVKRPVHAWTRAFTADDVRAALQFLAVTGLILPLVPNESMGPYQAFNPYSTWLMVVLISAIGFGGYVAMRWFGAHAGILVTGVFGGVASSTATTLSFSRRSAEQPEISGHCSLGIVIACTVMFPRIAVIVAVINSALAAALALPLAIMAAPALAAAVVLWFLHRRERADVDVPSLRNPLSLATALKFGVVYAVIAFLVKAARAAGWQAGLLPLSFASGLTNMDAIALSLAHGQSGTAAIGFAARWIIVAAIANTLMKAGIAMVLGSPTVRRQVAIVLGLTMLAGIGAAFVPLPGR